MGIGSEVHYEQTDKGDVLTDDSGERLSLVPDKRTIYTIGEGNSAVTEEPADVQIAGAENTVPNTSTARAIRVGDWVTFDGFIFFDGANGALTFTLPVELVPQFMVTIPIVVWDNSEVAYKPGVLTVMLAEDAENDGDTAIQLTDGAALAADDSVYLSGSYLVAE